MLQDLPWYGLSLVDIVLSTIYQLIRAMPYMCQHIFYGNELSTKKR